MQSSMIPEAAAQSMVHPISLLFVGACILLIFLLPKKYVFVPFLFTAFFVPLGQVFVIGGLHLMMFRVVLIFAWIRVLFDRGAPTDGSPGFQWNAIDKLLIAWAIANVTTYWILWGTFEAFVNRLGTVYNAFGIYFLLRLLCKNAQDIDRMAKSFVAIAMVIAACMLNEQFTGRNLFAVLGGVPEFTPMREGSFRSQGPFAHSILAGTFGATLFPLFIGLWSQGKRFRMIAAIGLSVATIMVLASKSSTPLMAYLAGIMALFMWPLRKNLRFIRWGVALVLLTLHLVMNAPVWAIIMRVTLVAGSSSWHRFQLVDEFINHFWEWWLVGTQSNASWGLDTWDTSNDYINTGVRGGLITLVLLVGIFAQGFKRLGHAMDSVAESDPYAERRLWAIGSMLFATMVGFFGVTYFDQTVVLWYALLAMISTATIGVKAVSAQPVPQISFLPNRIPLAKERQPVLPRIGLQTKHQ